MRIIKFVAAATFFAMAILWSVYAILMDTNQAVTLLTSGVALCLAEQAVIILFLMSIDSKANRLPKGE